MKIHIIPDWHQANAVVPQFNDSRHQAQLFLSQGQTVELVVLDYLPQLRLLLTNAQLELANVWSAFDQLQHIDLKAQLPLALADLNWPSGALFVRLQGQILVTVNQQHYATVYLTPKTDASLDHIDLYEADHLIQRLILDDRGFVSQVLTFEQDNLVRRDYLTPSGQVAIQEDCLTGQVTTQQNWTTQTQFDSINSLVKAVLKSHLSAIPDLDNVIMASGELNREIIQSWSFSQPVVMSWPAKDHEAMADGGHDKSGFNVVQTPADREYLSQQVSDDVNISIIPAFSTDNHVELTANDMVNPIKKIYWTTKSMSLTDQKVVVTQLIDLLANDFSTTIIFESTMLYPEIQAMVDQASLSAKNEHGLIDDDSQAAFKVRFQILAPQNEIKRQQLMAQTRVLIDLDEHPDQFLQSLALTFSVPQINLVATSYLVPQENGQLLAAITDLKDVLPMYLDNQDKFNQTQRAARELAKETNSEMLWIKWQQIFNKLKS